MTQLFKSAIRLIFVLSFISCSDGPAEDLGKKLLFVEVSSKAPPKKRCKEIGDVIGAAYDRGKNRYQLSMRDIKTHTAHQGGNYVQIKSVENRGEVVRGLAYICEKAQAEEEAEEEKPAS